MYVREHDQVIWPIFVDLSTCQIQKHSRSTPKLQQFHRGHRPTLVFNAYKITHDIYGSICQRLVSHNVAPRNRWNSECTPSQRSVFKTKSNIPHWKVTEKPFSEKNKTFQVKFSHQVHIYHFQPYLFSVHNK